MTAPVRLGLGSAAATSRSSSSVSPPPPWRALLATSRRRGAATCPACPVPARPCRCRRSCAGVLPRRCCCCPWSSKPASAMAAAGVVAPAPAPAAPAALDWPWLLLLPRRRRGNDTTSLPSLSLPLWASLLSPTGLPPPSGRLDRSRMVMPHAVMVQPVATYGNHCMRRRSTRAPLGWAQWRASYKARWCCRQRACPPLVCHRPVGLQTTLPCQVCWGANWEPGCLKWRPQIWSRELQPFATHSLGSASHTFPRPTNSFKHQGAQVDPPRPRTDPRSPPRARGTGTGRPGRRGRGGEHGGDGGGRAG